MNCGTGQDASKAKRYNHLFYQCTLNDSSTYGHGATSFTQRKARKNPLKDKRVDWTSGVFITWSFEDRRSSKRLGW